MTILLSLVQLSFWFYGRALVTSAAQHGLDATRVAEGSSAAGTDTIDQFVAQTGGLDLTDVDVERGDEQATVRVEGDVMDVLPIVDISVRVTLQGPVERVVE